MFVTEPHVTPNPASTASAADVLHVSWTPPDVVDSHEVNDKGWLGLAFTAKSQVERLIINLNATLADW